MLCQILFCLPEREKTILFIDFGKVSNEFLLNSEYHLVNVLILRGHFKRIIQSFLHFLFKLLWALNQFSLQPILYILEPFRQNCEMLHFFQPQQQLQYDKALFESLRFVFTKRFEITFLSLLFDWLSAETSSSIFISRIILFIVLIKVLIIFFLMMTGTIRI